MSEQTPNSPEGLRGAEPSMEDILASIRKIISDDEPVAMESPEDIPRVDLVETSQSDDLDDLMQGIHMDSNDLTSDAVLDAESADDASFAAEGDSVDLNIEDVLAELDRDISKADQDSVSLAALEQPVADDALSSVFDDLEADVLEADTPVSTLEVAQLDDVVPEMDDDILAFLDEDIPLASEPTASFAKAAPLAAAGMIPAIAAVKMTASEPEKVEHESVTADDDMEMDALLDDILLGEAEAEEEFQIEDLLQTEPVETDFSADLSVADLAETEEMSDLDLVKSLMADLADDPDEFVEDEDLDALLAIPEVEGEAEVDELLSAFSGVEPEAVATPDVELEDDIMGDIVDMTIEDELQSHPDDIEVPDDIEMINAQVDDFKSLDDVLEAEQHNIAENTLPIEDLSIEELLGEDTQADDFLSLSEIAASAEADAVAVETASAPQAFAATAGLAAVVGGAALGATAHADTAQAETEIDNTLAEADIQIETAEAYSEPTAKPILESHPTQETSMPVQAVKTDAILDDVTETATAGAFAELNQVVEDKAIFSERGPRIGDLVQDALRPMLKEWLDANLKGIVERAVTKEVKRISSGK